MKKSSHNGIISFWKFAFCIMIIALHLGVSTNVNLFRAGSIGVEFFFIVSGYLLGKSALKENVSEDEIGEKTNKFILKKVARLFPYMLFSWIFAMILYINTNPIKYAAHDVVNSIWDLFFLKNSGLIYRSFLAVSWYISAMLICMIGLYPLILKQKKKFVYVTAPLIVILVGGFIANKYQSIAFNGDIYVSMLRALFELSLGVIIYNWSSILKNVEFTKLGRFILTCIEILGFASIFFIVNLENAHVKYDFIMILIISMCICIAFSEKTLEYKLFNNKLFYFLENLSLPMYLNQYFAFNLMYFFLNSSYYRIPYGYSLLIALGIDILISIIIILLIKVYKELIKRISKMLVASSREVIK